MRERGAARRQPFDDPGRASTRGRGWDTDLRDDGGVLTGEEVQELAVRCGLGAHAAQLANTVWPAYRLDLERGPGRHGVTKPLVEGGDWTLLGTGGPPEMTPEPGLSSGRGGFRTCDLSRVKNEEPADPDAESEP